MQGCLLQTRCEESSDVQTSRSIRTFSMPTVSTLRATQESLSKGKPAFCDSVLYFSEDDCADWEPGQSELELEAQRAEFDLLGLLIRF